MKIFHLSDLHLGKRLLEYSLIEDQKYILDRITERVGEEKPDAVVIAGDVYDRTSPSREAVILFDSFLTELKNLGCAVFVISGNHDSPERISFGSSLISSAGVYMSPIYCGKVEPIVLDDQYGKVAFYMLPFIKPSAVRGFFVDREIESYTDAVDAAVSSMEIVEGARSVLITHQFVTGSDRSESEELSVGGTDNVDASVFDRFDYVALGHLHKAQYCTRPEVRYSGTPLKYSFSEKDDEKSITVVELGARGVASISTIPLTPLVDMHELRGSFSEISSPEFYKNCEYRDQYLRIILTDECEVSDSVSRLRLIYPRLLKLKYEIYSADRCELGELDETVVRRSPKDVLAEFFTVRTGKEMNGEQRELVFSLIDKIWEEEE